MKKMILKLTVTMMIFFISNVYAAEQGITDTEIHIGQFGPLSGPAIAWGSVVKGSGIMFNIINEEGGINGRKIVYHSFDDGYTPAKTKFGVKQLQESPTGIFVWLGGIGTATALSVKDYIANRNIPWFAPMSGAKEFSDPPNKYIFAAYPLLSTEASIICNYAAKTMNKTKIAMIYQNDGYGKTALEGANDRMNKLNMKLIAQIPVEANESNFQSHALELRKSEADAVLVWLTPFAALRLLQSAKQMQYEPQWLGGVSFSDFPLMHKISKGMWTGMITTNVCDYTDTPVLQKYKEAVKKYAEQGEIWSTFYQVGFIIAEPIIEAMKRCGKDLTREKLVEELEKLNKFKGVGGEVSYKPLNASDPECRRGLKSLNIIKCKDNGEAEQLSGFVTE